MKHAARWLFSSVTVISVLWVTGCSKSESDHGHTQSSGNASAHHHAGSGSPPVAQAKPHGSHDAAHGGLVLMDGHDHHAELVLDVKAGHHRIYVSDGARAPLPASTFDEVTLRITPAGGAPEDLKLTRASDDSHWMAMGKPVPTTGTKVKLGYSKAGKSLYDVELPVEYVLTGKMPDVPGTTAATPTHSGQIAATPSGPIELVADAGGKFQVWLLDSAGKARPAPGPPVRVSLSKKGYKDVELAPIGDHFEGQGAAIPGGHATATVTVAGSGTTESATIPLHLEKGGGHGH